MKVCNFLLQILSRNLKVIFVTAAIHLAEDEFFQAIDHEQQRRVKEQKRDADRSLKLKNRQKKEQKIDENGNGHIEQTEEPEDHLEENDTDDDNQNDEMENDDIVNGNGENHKNGTVET